MKRLFLNFAVAASILAVTSCEDDGGDLTINQEITTNNNGGGDTGGGTTEPDTDLSGFVLPGETLELDGDLEYSLNGPLVVKDGGTLRIPAGTKIIAQGGADVYIAVTKGGRIYAEGTSSDPILMTAATASPGAWGGLIVLGDAPINSGETATSEIGGFNYGGTNAGDNSGVIEYVVLEYSGGAVDASSENNGFSFYGVGNGTTVNHIESYYGKDDGIEFFGGTVNVDNIVLIGNEDDSLDYTEGFSGTVTDVYIRHEGEFDKAIEGDGFNPDLGINVEPAFYSNPTISNVTIIGMGSDNDFQGGAPGALGSYEAVRLREGTQGTFSNFRLEGFARGFRLKGNGGDGSVTVTTGDHVLADLLNATASFSDVTTAVVNDSGTDFNDGDFLTTDNTASGTDVDSWASSWAVGL